MKRMVKDFARGLWDENPVYRLLIGLCPALAVTTSASNGLYMGMATTFVLVCSSAIVSVFKKLIPSQVRIPCFIIIIATFVTIVDLFMNAMLPDVHRILGLFIPLIVVNCVVLGRAEAYASKMPLLYSIFDALGMGLGFTWALMSLGAVREILGAGTLFQYPILGEGFTTWSVMVLPPGAFLSLGVLLGLLNFLSARKKMA